MADNVLNSFCENCGNLLKKEHSSIETQTELYKYQCDNCYNITNGVECKYEKSFDECSLCFQGKIDNIISYIIFDDCQHYICYSCFLEMTEYFEKLTINCPFCRNELKFDHNIKTGYKHININNMCSIIPNKLKPYFMEIVPFILFYHDQQENKIIKKDINKIFMYIEEYYKWLLIVSNKELAPNGANDVSPSTTIDSIWHQHILDTKNYEFVCKEIAGEIIHHYPKHSFAINDNKRAKRFENTEKIYKKMFLNDMKTYNNNIEYIYTNLRELLTVWNFLNLVNNDELLSNFSGEKIEIFIKLSLNEKCDRLEVKKDMKLFALLLIVSKMFWHNDIIICFYNKPICGSGHYFDEYKDNLNKTLEDFNITDCTTLRVIMPLRGC
jgi:hypothetical protein